MAKAGMPYSYSTPFDNRSLRGLLARPKSDVHLKLELAGKTIGYTYIRKNGSSVFKKLLGYDRNTNVGAILREHALDPKEPTDHMIFVYRDPIDRMKSLFQNKFIDKDGHADITSAFEASMEGAPVTFSNFLIFAAKGLDPHCWTQVSHLRACRYTNAIALSDLHAAMVELAGPDAAAPFEAKANPSEPPLFQVASDDLATIRHIYRADYQMIAAITKKRPAN